MLVVVFVVVFFIGYYLGGLKPKPVSAGILDDLLMPPLLYSGTSQYGFLYIVFIFCICCLLLRCCS